LKGFEEKQMESSFCMWEPQC